MPDIADQRPLPLHLHHFHGGLALDPHKLTHGDILPGPRPRRLVLPLQQHAGPPNLAQVHVGDRVAQGQLLAIPDASNSAPGRLGAAIHAPCAAQVVAIEAYPLVSNPEVHGLAIVLECDDHAIESDAPPLPPIENWRDAPREALLARLRDAGIAGLGGAVFPTADKLSGTPGLTLILNGAECEPYISCDDALIRGRPLEVIHGGMLLAQITGAGKVILAVEDRMRDALAAASTAIANHCPGCIELVPVFSLYPEGGERQLVEVLTGRQVPRGGLPRDVGVIVQNVATAAAAWAAVRHGQPLTHRTVTVAGSGVRHPGNYEVAFGTPIADVVETAGGYTPQARRLLIGGPMMGQALPDDSFPIVKSSNCVLVLGDELPATPQREMPCIRCGECARVCPARLLPQQLLAFARGEQWDRLESHGIRDCIECGCCDLACPSAIPLVSHFRWGKSALRERERAASLAASARERHHAREERIAAEQAERAARRRNAAAPDAVAAALERAKAKAAGQSKPGESPENDQA